FLIRDHHISKTYVQYSRFSKPVRVWQQTLLLMALSPGKKRGPVFRRVPLNWRCNLSASLEASALAHFFQNRILHIRRDRGVLQRFHYAAGAAGGHRTQLGGVSEHF